MKFRVYVFSCAALLLSTSALAGADPDEFAEIDLADRPSRVDIISESSEDTSRRGITAVDLYGSDKAAQLVIEGNGSAISLSDSRIRLGFLFNEERDNIFTGGVLLDAEPSLLPGVTMSIGGKAYIGLLGIENADVVGVSMGVEALYEPALDNLPLLINGSIYYAPDIFTFGQSDRVFDWQLDAGLKVRETVTVYAGYRYLQFDTRPGEREVDKRIHVGLRWHVGHAL